MDQYGLLQRKITDKIRREMDEREFLEDGEILSEIEALILRDEEARGFSLREKRELIETVFNATRKELDVLQPYADDEEISEIMVNGEKDVFIEKRGKIRRASVHFENKRHLEEIVRRLAAKVHREINELNPIVDARLSDGSRINAVYSNIALNGPILTIRKFPKNKLTMEDLISQGTITAEARDFLKLSVNAGLNIFISGGTSSGKTTFLEILAGYIPSRERVVVIEDSAELQIGSIENIVRLETKNANAQGKGAVGIRQLIKVALRMRPDRILIGEVRGAEALDMLQAMNSGHDGSLSTGHANTAEGMLSRLETMILTAENFPIEAIRGQIASAIDLMVHLGRFENMERRVLEISEMEGMKDGKILLNPLFLFREGSLQATGNFLKHRLKFEMRGGEEGRRFLSSQRESEKGKIPGNYL